MVPLFPVSQVREVAVTSAKDLIDEPNKLVSELDDLLEDLNNKK